MKKSVQQYKTLVEKIQAGDEVSFGQMEKVFAPAFLENFLKRILGGEEREKLRAFQKKALAEAYQGEDIDPDQLEPSTRQLVAQEIELVRMVSGALGVRPTLNDLSNYLQESIRGRNWELMNKILSLSQEGKLERGILERAALEDLVRDRKDSYQELKKAFPDLQFSRELVVPAYEQILKEGEFDRLQTIRAETSVPIPAQPVQETYQRIIGYLEENTNERNNQHLSEREFNQRINTHLGWLEKLQAITRVALPKTDETVQHIAYVSAEEDLDSSHLEKINDLFGLYSDPILAQKAQEAALAKGNISGFTKIFKRSPHKVATSTVKNATDDLYQQVGAGRAAALIEETRVAPSPETWKNICSELLRRDCLSQLEKLSQVTGEPLSFEQDALAQGLSARRSSLRDMRQYVQVLGRAGISVPAGSINEALTNYVRARVSNKDFTSMSDVTELQSLYDEIDVKMPVEIAGLQIDGVVSELEQRVLKLEREHSKHSYWGTVSPLNPVKRENVKEYHAFAKAATSAFKEAVTIAKKIKKDHPRACASQKETDNYLPLLELVLAQASQEEKILPVQQLMQETGIELSSLSWRNALAYHLSHARSIPEHAGSMLEHIAQQTGLATLSQPVPAGDKEVIVTNVLGSQPLHELQTRLHYARALLNGFEITPVLESKLDSTATECLLKGNGHVYEQLVAHIGGSQKLSSNSQQRIKGEVVTALQEINISRYDYLAKTSGLSFTFDQPDRKRVRMNVIAEIVKDPKKYREVQSINECLGVAITATHSELKNIVSAYFAKEGAWALSTDSIAASLGQQLDKGQIANRVIELVNTQNDVYCAKELAKRTGIVPDQVEIDDEIRKGTDIDTKMTRLDRFKAVCPSYTPSPSVVTQLYSEAYQGDKLWSIQKILRETKQTPPQNITNAILERSWNITLQAGEKDWAADDLTKELLKKHNVNPPYNPTQLKERILSEASRQWYPFNEIYEKVERASEVHQFVPEFNRDEQEKLLQSIESRVNNSRGYTPLRRELEGSVIANARRYAPRIFTYPELRETATRKAAEFFASDGKNLYQGFAYSVLTGVQPQFTPEEYAQYRSNFQELGYQMRKSDLEYLQEHLDAWKPEVV